MCAILSYGIWQSIKVFTAFKKKKKLCIWLGNRYVCHGNYPLLHISHKINEFFPRLNVWKMVNGVDPFSITAVLKRKLIDPKLFFFQ